MQSRLTGGETLDRFLAETWVEHKRVATAATSKGVAWCPDQHVVPAPAYW